MAITYPCDRLHWQRRVNL